MGEFYRAHSDQVRFLGIDLADDRQAALAMAAQTKMTFPSVQDPNSEVRAGLRVVGVPTTLFVRPDGSIAGRTSVVSKEELASLIDKYLQVKVSRVQLKALESRSSRISPTCLPGTCR